MRRLQKDSRASRMLGASLTLALLSATATATPVAGNNINMVAGKPVLEESPFFLIEGDPYLQRQNEPSCDVSTRNPMHVFCASNDYRTVDVPGLPDDLVTGDAWMGLYWSNNGGRTFRSTLLPGFQQDTTSAGQASPLYGYEAAADPTVRGGTNGMFYLSGIAFDRALTQGAAAPTGGAGGAGVVFLQRFIDLNDSPADQRPVRALGQPLILGQGTATRFLDKPWMVVDKPRENAGTCTFEVPLDDDDPTQTITQSFPAGNVYVAYTAFIETPTTHKDDDDDDDDNDDDDEISHPKNRSELWVQTIRNCGNGPQDPAVKLSGRKKHNRINQGASLAVDPQTGKVIVVWRRFKLDTGQSDAILYSVSDDFGSSWSKAALVAEIPDLVRSGDGSTASGTFDQGSTSHSARTNAFPSVAIADSGVAGEPGSAYVVWAQRQPTPIPGLLPREARIMISVLPGDGAGWSAPGVVDGTEARGHQYQPSITYNNGALTLAYLDLREDHTAGIYQREIVTDPGDPAASIVKFTETRQQRGDLTTSGGEQKVRTDFNIDAAPANPNPEFAPQFSRYLARRHTLDVRVRQFEPFHPLNGMPAGDSVKITRFPFALRNGQFEQALYNAGNIRLFAQGSIAFLGDYIDCRGAGFIPEGNDWTFNSTTDSDPIVFCTWTDNRNVVLAPDNTTGNYTPPGTSQCSSGYAGTRNQDVFNSRITRGLHVGSLGNFRPLGMAAIDDNPATPEYDPQQYRVQRAFDVTLDNLTNQTRHYRMTIPAQPSGEPDAAWASFSQRDRDPAAPGEPGYEAPQTDQLVTVPPLQSRSTSVFVTSSVATASVRVDVAEVDLVGAPVTGGQRGYVVLNADPTNPPPRYPDPNLPAADIPDPNLVEIYDLTIDPAIFNDTNFLVGGVAAPDPNNPDPNNPDPNNPDPNNVLVQFADPTNPDPQTPDPNNPDPNNPDPNNPDPNNPDPNNAAIWTESVSNPDFVAAEEMENSALNDTHWQLQNNGNVAVTYSVRLIGKKAVPEGVRLQLIVHKTDEITVAHGVDQCQRGTLKSAVVLLSKPNPVLEDIDSVRDPDPNNPDPNNATFTLGPGEQARVTIRVLDTDTTDGNTFFPADDIEPVIFAPVDTYHHLLGEDVPGGTVVGGVLFATDEQLPNAVTLQNDYSVSIETLGGSAPFSWTIDGQLPDNLNFVADTGRTAQISGDVALQAEQEFDFTLHVTEGRGRTASRSFRIQVCTLPGETTPGLCPLPPN